VIVRAFHATATAEGADAYHQLTGDLLDRQVGQIGQREHLPIAQRQPAQRVRQLQLVGRELRWLAGRAEPATQTKGAAGAPQHLQG
jgi:hypothetical protein